MTFAPQIVNSSDKNGEKFQEEIEQHVHCIVQLRSQRNIYHCK